MGAIDFDLERRLVPDLVGILASWSEFSEKHDIPTWIAHGTLLGWFWNQRILPWDTDLDFQVPVQSLATLTALNLTRSSDGRYVLEVNPHAAYRMRQENNTIDARWIDMRTGLFLDITALSNTYSIRAKDTPKHASSKISCKNGHQSSHYEISPLVLTRLEGVKVWRPARPLTLLKREYEEISMQSRFWNYRGEQFVFDEEEMRWKCYMVNVPADDSAEELRIAKESWCKEK
ncbi:LicD family-domain-containing protein [Cladochytrium replicatum]|nr:LicD family-domain-containing protein [Cladochytrium replicatum]